VTQTPLRYRLCPHWWREIDPQWSPVTYVIERQERCRICGKVRTFARVPEPHPSRDKADVRERLEQHGEFIITEWFPYGRWEDRWNDG